MAAFAQETVEADPIAEIAETGTKYASVKDAVLAAIERAKTPGGGSTVKLLSEGGQVREDHFPRIEDGFFPGADRALTLDLNGCELTVGTDGTNPIDIWPNNHVTIKDGKIKTFFSWRDLVRIYGTADDTFVTFDNVELYDDVIGPGHGDTENEPEAHVIVRIIGGNVAFTGSTSINDSETSKTVYAVKVGNGHNERFSVGTVKFDTTGNIKGKVLLAGGDFVESAVGTGSAIHYRYGKNVYSTYADDKAADGEGRALFEARVGVLPEVGNDANDAGTLCKLREHALVSVRSVDETVTLLKGWTPGQDVTVYARLAVANGARITLDGALLTEFGGALDATEAFTDEGVTRFGEGPYTYTAREASGEPAVVRTSLGEYVLDFQLPEGQTLSPQKVAAIESSNGVTVIGFQPPRGLLLRMTEPNRLNALGKVGGVRRASLPTFLENDFEPGSETVTVDVFPWGADLAETVGAKIVEMGGTVVSNHFDRDFGSWGRIRAKLPAGSVRTLAAVGDVRRIRKPLRVELLNNVARKEMNMNVEAVYPTKPVGDTLGLTGEGQVVGHADTGLDANSFDDPAHPMHPDFNTTNVMKIIMLSETAAQDVAGHGTHTLGSIVGSGASSNGVYRGIAYGARAVTQVLGLECADSNGGDFGGANRSFTDDPPWELANIYQQTYDLGARVHSDSWGWESTFSYEEPCAKADLYVFEHPEMLVVVSAGNSFDKDPGGYGAIVEPAAGKNILAVGAYGNYGDDRTYHNHVVKNDNYVYQGQLADFSSRGPATPKDPDRIKPDICAPGIYITSTHSRYDLDTDHEKPYTVFSGTSMSSPLTAGAALLLREYLAKREGIKHPSSPLLRAAFIGGAKPILTYEAGKYYDAPNIECGWGGVDVGGTLAPTNALTRFVDHIEENLAGGAAWTTTLTVTNSAEQLRIALAWTDYPGSDPDVPALVNDYDLVVTDPSGNRVWCNGLAGEDRANVQETVVVNDPAEGEWTVTVRPYQVVVDGSVLGLYCRGGFEALPSAPGSEGNPWKVGAAGHEDEVTAWTNGAGKLVVEGAGAVGTMPWAESAAGISKLVKAEGVTGLEGIMATLPDLANVNALTLDELASAGMLGAVKATGFSAIKVKGDEAKLDVVIGRSDTLDESAEWKPVSTNEAVVPAPGEQGFFIVVPQVISK